MKRLPVLSLLFLGLFLLTGTNSKPSFPFFTQIDGGASNHNYLLRTHNRDFFLRIGEQGENQLENEFICTQIAAAHQIAPEVVLYRPKRQLMITRFIPNHSLVDLRDKRCLVRTVATIRNLHQIEDPFPKAQPPTTLIQELLQNTPNAHPIIEHKIMPAIATQKALYNSETVVPCHLDLHRGNCIDDGLRVRLIDWEYAAMSDPLFDLATLAATEEMDDKEMWELLQIYKPHATENDWKHLYNMRVLADLRWALWSYNQLDHSSLNSPYKKWAEQFLESCLSRLNP